MFFLDDVDDVRVGVPPPLPDVALRDEVGHEGADVRPRRRARAEDSVLQRGVHAEGSSRYDVHAERRRGGQEIQASPLTVTVLGQQKSVTVS